MRPGKRPDFPPSSRRCTPPRRPRRGRAPWDGGATERACVAAIGNEVEIAIQAVVGALAAIAGVRCPVEIGVDRVVEAGARIAGVAHGVQFAVGLVGIGGGGAVVAGVTHRVAVGVGLVVGGGWTEVASLDDVDP